MAEIRINGLANTAQTASNDDYVVMDGATNGTRKMLAKKLTEGVEQQLATTNQNVAQNTEEIADLKEDLNNVVILSASNIENDLVWRDGAYRADGVFDNNQQFSAKSSNIIEGLKSIRVTAGPNSKVMLVNFDKTTHAYVNRTGWSNKSLAIDAEYDVCVCLSSRAVTQGSMTIEDFLSEVTIDANFADIESMFVKRHTVFQGWSGATQKPQTYYATYRYVSLKADDTVTAKTGFEIAIINITGATLKPWSTSYTETQNRDVSIIIRRTNANAEMLLEESGYLLSTYIQEDYEATDKRCNSFGMYGATLGLLEQSLKKWNGKKVAFVGDSITAGVNTLAGCIYYQFLNGLIGFSNVYADGIAGSCYSVTSNYGDTIKPISQRWQDIPTDRDLIVIFAGTNDWGHNTPIGSITDTTDVSLYGALNVVISGILEANPSARLVLMTPLHRWGFGDYPEDTGNNGQGKPLKTYVDAIKACAEMYGVPVIDLFSISSMNPRISAIKTAYVPDGLHPNASGHKLLADRIAPMLETV